MGDRLITLLGGTLALVIVVSLLMPASQPAPALSRPTTADRGEEGLAGLKRWLDEAGIATMSLRRRFTHLLDNPDLPYGGNLLVMTLPTAAPLQPRETKALAGWLKRGNNALFLMALNDSPTWAKGETADGGHGLLEALGYRLRVEGVSVPKDDSETLTAAVPHPIVDGVQQVKVAGNRSPRNIGLVGEPERHSALVVFTEETTGAGALLRFRIGDGHGWLSGYSNLFGNAILNKGDNARLFANIVGASLAGGAVIFDDMHQGLSDLYDPKAFFGDTRLHNTLLFVAAFWLIYALGRSNRLAPLRRFTERPSLAGHVHAAAGLLARRLTPAATGDRLLTHFFNETRARFRQPQNGEPVWDLLERHPQVDPQTLSALKAAARRLESRRRIDLISLVTQIQRIRKQIHDHNR